MFDFIWRSLAIGIGGTAAMDLWAIFLKAAFGVALPNWAMVGRWFAHLPRGTVFHKDIGKTEPVQNELAIGWIAHYAVGIVYGGILVLAAGPEWVKAPTFLPAFILGMVTIGAGWFLLQPGVGAGWAASLRPNPWTVRMFNILAHTVFAAGMFGTAWLISAY
ncbi:DUF2938 domain-containing protein [Aestuariivirga sp.]|uniref:DUF2938 domain-containing protein n=1 Tax=Aestuariivirga sp. TaxID=2650926 RepID=UPI003592EB7E